MACKMGLEIVTETKNKQKIETRKKSNKTKQNRTGTRWDKYIKERKLKIKINNKKIELNRSCMIHFLLFCVSISIYVSNYYFFRH